MGEKVTFLGLNLHILLSKIKNLVRKTAHFLLISQVSLGIFEGFKVGLYFALFRAKKI